MKPITKVSDNVNSTMWAWGTPLYTLDNKDYICPFCSHGETIELHRQSRKSVWGYGCDFKYYLSCIGGCMSYDVLKISGEHFDSDFDKQALDKAMIVFQKMVEFSNNFTDYKKDLNFIL